MLSLGRLASVSLKSPSSESLSPRAAEAVDRRRRRSPACCRSARCRRRSPRSRPSPPDLKRSKSPCLPSARRVLVLLERASRLALVAHLGEAEHVGIGAVGRHVEHADRDLGAEPRAHLRQRRAAVGGLVGALVEVGRRASGSSGSARRAPAGASRRRSARRCWRRRTRPWWPGRPGRRGRRCRRRPRRRRPCSSCRSRRARGPRGRERRSPGAARRRTVWREGVISRTLEALRRFSEASLGFEPRRCAGSRAGGAKPAAMPNIFEPEFDHQRVHPGFRALRARVGWQLEDAAPGRQHLGDRARRGRLPVPLPPGRGRAADRAHGTAERAHRRRVARARARRRAGLRARPRGRPPARQLGRRDRALHGRLDERHARPRRLPRLRQGRRLRAPARPGTGLWKIFRMADAVDYHEGERRPRPRVAERAKWHSQQCHLARSTHRAWPRSVDGRREPCGDRRRIIAVAPSPSRALRRSAVVRRPALDVTRARRGGGPRRGRPRSSGLAGSSSRLRARSAQYIVVWAVAPLLIWATYLDSRRSLAALALAAARSAALLGARERPGGGERGRARRAHHARGGHGRDRQRAALVRPAAALTAPRQARLVVWCGGDVHRHRRRARRVLAARTALVRGGARRADARADAGLAADRGAASTCCCARRPAGARRWRRSCGSSTGS